MSKIQNKQKKIYTFFLIDILCMKDINASYGFKNGDLIISQVLNVLNNLQTNISNFLDSKFSINIKHLYVDVFSIKINTKLNIQEIQKIKDLILSSIKEYKFEVKQSSNISIDLTISSTCAEKKNLRIYAEKALNNAKSNNNDFAFYDSNLVEENDNLLECIEYNIKENLVEAYFQKIVSCASEKTIKFEALMRLKDKDGKIIFPGSFIEKSKTYRLYPKLMSILIIKVINIIKEHKLNISI
ncbi:MAG: EAL domain-containing protein, partial [Campylobacteraceae bacterium]|nr:EAL domain-containing protein [Campylobacteraceae bacterium]